MTMAVIDNISYNIVGETEPFEITFVTYARYPIEFMLIVVLKIFPMSILLPNSGLGTIVYCF